MAHFLDDPPDTIEDHTSFELVLRHGHQDLVQAVAFNFYGDRCATGGVDGRIRVFNRHKDGVWRLCDAWAAHGGEILELQWVSPVVNPNLLASLAMDGRFRLWAEDPSLGPGRRFSGRLGRARHPGLPDYNAPEPTGDTAAGSATGSAAGSVTGSAVPSSVASTTSTSTASRDKPKAAFEMRSQGGWPYRSFSMRYADEARVTWLALLSADGRLAVYENDVVENLADFARVDEFAACARPGRGEEASFRVRFDPSPDVCYTALRAGVPQDALGLAVAAMDTVRIYRTRDTVTGALGVQSTGKEFYLAAEVTAHRGLVRDIAWAPGNIRGYDVLATACQDGLVRVYRLETPAGMPEGEGWAAQQLKKHRRVPKPAPEKATKPRKKSEAKKEAKGDTKAEGTKGGDAKGGAAAAAGAGGAGADGKGDAKAGAAASAKEEAEAADRQQRRSGIKVQLERARPVPERRPDGMPGTVRHLMVEVGRFDDHQTPVWRVAFDDEGHVLGSVGDDGRLLCYRQTPDGDWAVSAALTMMKVRMGATTP